MKSTELKKWLDEKVRKYNHPSFIENDPISVPHLFTRKQDIEIAGLFAAVFAWGNRTTIINKSKELMQLMEMRPYEFCLHQKDNELKKLSAFKHRTFQSTDLLYFIQFLRHHYLQHRSLESAFDLQSVNMEARLTAFHDYFFSLPNAPERTRKHVASPQRGSTCKRLNMFLRWMVRKDKMGVDFGVWKCIKPSELICPIDVHVARVSRKLGLIERKQTDWSTAIELTEALRSFDPKDPVKYDFALFSLGVNEKF